MAKLNEDSDLIICLSLVQSLEELTEEERKDYLMKKKLENGQLQKGHQRT